jgi:(E)-4-hydroxy-3-methyl-but-2-enyl pyrophosphate reductase
LEITLAKSAGFCFGVNRAVNMVYELLQQGKSVCTLGPIIHNPQLVKELSDKGVIIIENPEQLSKDSTLVIRSHGIPQQIYKQMDDLNLNYVDATCPFVTKIHNIVKANSSKGAIVFIAGDPEHPEVEGIKSFSSSDVFIFNSLEELEFMTNSVAEISEKNIIVVAQTTFNTDVWQKCIKYIKKVYTNTIIFDTICDATSIRQQEAKEIAKTSELMLVIGGKHSSNTEKLYTICSELCPSMLIEDVSELPLDKIRNVKKIGVTAGASTPARIIKEALKTMSDINNTNDLDNEDFNFLEALEMSFKTVNSGEKVRGLVVGISAIEVQIDIGTKHAGYIPFAELTNDPLAKVSDIVKVGDELDLIAVRVNDIEGTVMLSKRRLDAYKGWEDVVKACEDETTLSGIVVEVINGGVLAVTKGVKVFIPASQSGVGKNENLDMLLRKNVKLKIIDINTDRKRAVGSIRAASKDERQALADKFWAEVAIGQQYSGTVKSLTTYGAFVDIGGVDGMVHISELSWSRVKHPSDVVSVGDVVSVTIKDLNMETRKISLTLRKAEDNPWEKFNEQYKVGDIVDAKIISFMPFGAFAQISAGVDGLIHISQISEEHVAKPQDALKIGETVKVKITEIEPTKKRISLSIKELLKPTIDVAVQPEEVVAPAPEPKHEIAEEAVSAEEIASVEETVSQENATPAVEEKTDSI